ncbi:MAG: hypothetical protein U1E25_15040 [Methylocystis sp.]
MRRKLARKAAPHPTAAGSARRPDHLERSELGRRALVNRLSGAGTKAVAQSIARALTVEAKL